MHSYHDAITELLSKNEFKTFVVMCIMDAGKYYIMSAKPKDAGLWDDGYFKYDKKSGKLTEYSPVMNPEEFKKAEANVIWQNPNP